MKITNQNGREPQMDCCYYEHEGKQQKNSVDRSGLSFFGGGRGKVMRTAKHLTFRAMNGIITSISCTKVRRENCGWNKVAIHFGFSVVLMILRMSPLK